MRVSELGRRGYETPTNSRYHTEVAVRAAHRMGTKKNIRQANNKGEILKVKILANGTHVLVSTDRLEEIVLLQLGRSACLLNLPEGIRRRFAAGHYASTRHVVVEARNSCSSGFSFDGSLKNSVHLQDLPEGQIVDLYPLPAVSVRCLVPPPVLRAFAEARYAVAA